MLLGSRSLGKLQNRLLLVCRKGEEGAKGEVSVVEDTGDKGGEIKVVEDGTDEIGRFIEEGNKGTKDRSESVEEEGEGM